MEYLTYTEYQTYGGKLEESAFSRLEYRARKKIDGYTFGRLKTEDVIPEVVKRLVFEMIGTMNNNDVSGENYSPAVASEGNDGYSVSFASGTILTIDATERKLSNLIDEYLADERDSHGTPLLYCGVH